MKLGRNRAPPSWPSLVAKGSFQLGLGCIQLSCWSRWSRGNPQTSQAVAKPTGFSPQTASLAPLVRATPSQLTDYGEFKLVPILSLQFHILVSSLWKGTFVSYPKINVNTHPAVNPLIYLPARCAIALVSQNLWEWSTMRRNPCLTLLGQPRTCIAQTSPH